MRALTILALGLIACGQSPNRQPGAATGGSGGLDRTPDSDQTAISTADVDASTPSPTIHAPCWPDSADALPACADGIGEGTPCDGSSSACATVTDSGAAFMNVCQNLGDGIALQWTRVLPVSTPCPDRADTCADAGLPRLDLRALLDRCVGDESWIMVSITDGCATSFTISDHDPTRIACVTNALSGVRYSCISGPACAGALLSTLE